MALFSGARHPRWMRFFIASGFVAAVAIGGSFGLEQRTSPVTLAAGEGSLTAVQPSGIKLPDTHVQVPLFVVPEPPAYTPYGTHVTIPHLGVPETIALTDPSSANNPTLSCDLLSDSISRKVFVVDAEGNPVAGAPVTFIVSKSGVDEPQMVSDVTGFDGSATVTVKVPVVSAVDKSFATYSILAQAFTVDSATPVDSVRFAIADFTCSGVAGGR